MPQDYHKIRIKKQLKTQKVLKQMTAEQRAAIEEIQVSVAQCIEMIKECNDLYMSDVAKLESSWHSLRWAFEVDNI
jgi:hypothetical protein|tara:strand:+ start:238 stop:465 length:228 start_codon:yes stop_codon:yes gene_type:complete